MDGGGSINTCSDIARNPNMQSMPSIEYGTADLYRVGDMPIVDIHLLLVVGVGSARSSH